MLFFSEAVTIQPPFNTITFSKSSHTHSMPFSSESKRNTVTSDDRAQYLSGRVHVSSLGINDADLGCQTMELCLLYASLKAPEDSKELS